MKETLRIPHYIFASHISINSNNHSGAFFRYEKEEIARESGNLKDILHAVHDQPEELFCWFTMDKQFNRRQSMIIEAHLERLIEDQIQNEWKVNVLLVARGHSGNFVEYQAQLELIFLPLSKKYPDEPLNHLISDGADGLLSQAFMIEAIRHFEERYRSIYWNGTEVSTIHHEMHVDLKDWFNLFKTFISDCDYQAALELMNDVDSQSLQMKAIKGILQSQVKRMNFAFEEADVYLSEVIHLLPAQETLQEAASIFKKLLNSDMQEKELERIVELLRHIDVYLETDDLSSFLVRFYRVREAVLYYLMDYARTSENKGKIERLKKSSIYQVFELLEEQYDAKEIDGYYGAYFFLKSTNTYNVLQFRNRSFLGHARKMINPKDLWISFAGTHAITAAKAKRRFQMDVDLLLRDLGVSADDNFYSINNLLMQLVDKFMEKEGSERDKTAANAQ